MWSSDFCLAVSASRFCYSTLLFRPIRHAQVASTSAARVDLKPVSSSALPLPQLVLGCLDGAIVPPSLPPSLFLFTSYTLYFFVSLILLFFLVNLELPTKQYRRKKRRLPIPQCAPILRWIENNPLSWLLCRSSGSVNPSVQGLATAKSAAIDRIRLANRPYQGSLKPAKNATRLYAGIQSWFLRPTPLLLSAVVRKITNGVAFSETSYR